MIDLDAIEARAKDYVAYADSTPILAEDVLALVARCRELEKRDREWGYQLIDECRRAEAAESVVMKLEGLHPGKRGYEVYEAIKNRAEAAEAEQDALGKTALEQAERAEKAEARVNALEAMAKLSADCVERSEKACETLNAQRNVAEARAEQAERERGEYRNSFHDKIIECDGLTAKLAIAVAALTHIAKPEYAHMGGPHGRREVARAALSKIAEVKP